jgi:hypothetical protein
MSDKLACNEISYSYDILYYDPLDDGNARWKLRKEQIFDFSKSMWQEVEANIHDG